MSEYSQMNLFESAYEKPTHLPSHIRLIEFFAGIGAQAKALEVLNADFEHWRTCEWSWQSITAYNAIHMGAKVEDTSHLTYEEVLAKIAGVSNDYNQPMSEKQLRAKGEQWARTLLGRMMVNHNVCPDVSRLKGEDLDIREREPYLYPHVFVPVPRPHQRGAYARHGEGQRDPKRIALGGRAHPIGVQRPRLPSAGPCHGERARRHRREQHRAV